MPEFLNDYSTHLVLILIYLVLNAVLLLVMTYINRRLFLPEVGKEQVLLYNIQVYRELGVKASLLKQEGFRIIAKNLSIVRDLRKDGRSDMQIWQKLEEEYNPENLLHHIYSLKKDFSYLPTDMIDTIKELEKHYAKFFLQLDFNKYNESEKFNKLTDKLLMQIRINTADIMSRKKEFSELLYTMPDDGFASRLEIDAAKELAEKLQTRDPEQINDNN